MTTAPMRDGTIEPMRALREGDGDAPGTGAGTGTDDAVAGRPPRIRCPLCMWQPRASDRWSCFCGCRWNTFETGGRCPDCRFRYEQTMCLACHQWSRHSAWYVDGAPS